MRHLENAQARLSARQSDPDVLVVEIAGDWLKRAGLPDISGVEKELAEAPKKALKFDASLLGGWDSALMVRILAIHDLCARTKVEFQANTLPPGLAKLIALSQAVPEKKDAARQAELSSFLQQVGESGLEVWTGGKVMLSFLGENVLALVKMVRGRAQFRVPGRPHRGRARRFLHLGDHSFCRERSRRQLPRP